MLHSRKETQLSRKAKAERQERVTELGVPFFIRGRYCGLIFKSTFVLMCVTDAGHRDSSGHCS